MAVTMKKTPVMPGVEHLEVNDGTTSVYGLAGIAPCLKRIFQLKLPFPTIFLLPDEFFAKGVVQVCLEFFVYYFLFVMGKAFGKLPADAKLVVIGTADQLARARRILEVTLFGFTADEIRTWRSEEANGHRAKALAKKTIAMLRKYRAWFAPKVPGFAALKAFVAKILAHQTHNAPLPVGDYAVIFAADATHPLVQAFVERYRAEKPEDVRLAAYEFAFLDLGDIIEWRAYDPNGTAPFALGTTVHRKGDNVFALSSGTDVLLADCSVTESQASYLMTLPPKPAAVEPDAFTILCLGSDSGFEIEHPTTGFAIALNGNWVVVDTPVCASHLLGQQGVNVADVRVILETHGHEDHMGSSIHFLLDCVTTHRAFTYVAAEPVYRTTVAKMAAILGEPEEAVERRLAQSAPNGTPRGTDVPRGGVIRVTPGEPIRLLGATWEFAYMVHPIPTTGFRITFAHGERTYRIAYSSDTNRIGGFAGLEAMAAEQFYDPKDDPFPALVHGDEDRVFWEAGGSNGDPIHVDVQDWAPTCARYGVDPPVTFMHVHPLPVAHRHLPIARPGDVWTIARQAPVAVADAVAVHEVLGSLRVRDSGYWHRVLLTQTTVERFGPGTKIVTEGEAGTAVYFVTRGEVEVVIGGKPVARLGARAFFGEIAVLEDGNRRATVRAVGPVAVLRVPATTFRDFVIANDLWDFFAKFWERVGLLGKTRLFLGFPHEVVAALAAHAERRTYASGDVLIRQGTTGDELFVIESGSVRIVKHGGVGADAEVIFGTRGPGEVVGEFGVFIPNAKRTATVSAETDTTVLVLTGAQIHAVVAGQLPLQLRVEAMLRERGIAPPAAA